jgi:hypothetical protein
MLRYHKPAFPFSLIAVGSLRLHHAHPSPGNGLQSKPREGSRPRFWPSGRRVGVQWSKLGIPFCARCETANLNMGAVGKVGVTTHGHEKTRLHARLGPATETPELAVSVAQRGRHPSCSAGQRDAPWRAGSNQPERANILCRAPPPRRWPFPANAAQAAKRDPSQQSNARSP